MQRALLQWKKPEMRKLVIEALVKAGREDLIGYDKKCLLRPRPGDEIPAAEEKGRGERRNGAPRAAGRGRARNEDGARANSGRPKNDRSAAAPFLRPSQKRSGKNNRGRRAGPAADR
jgi:hypothetical protein